ncbi:MAG: exodeoxyribonuclease V subunit gamma, partial [Desulfosarcinaceae bacterium]
MPVALFFSNRIEQLASRLADRLYAGASAEGHPFAVVRLVVPNRNLAKWLQLHLARQLGVSMNIDYAFLDRALWELLLLLRGGDVAPLPVDQDIYTLALLRVLEHLPPGQAVFEPIRAYLTPATDPAQAGGERSAQGMRRWQLAARLAHLFLEYELNRPEWTAAWQAGRVKGGGMTACQGRLYRRTLDLCDQLGAHLGRPVMSLPRLARQLLPAKGGGGRAAALAGSVVNIFGLSQISAFHTDLIGQLSSQVTFRIFALNPSEAFWEDVRTPREKRREAVLPGEATRSAAPADMREAEGESDLFAAGDHPLLSLWGKPGRENVRRLCELADYDFQAVYRSPETPPSVLGRLQESLRCADVNGPLGTGGQDTSLQVMACPGPLREVETVYQRILYYLERDPALQLTDIAVLVPDMGQRAPRQLGYSLADTLAETESHFGRGVLALLDLISGRFSRAEVLGLMMNPLFLARWQVDMEMVGAWAGWIEALNIYHSFDAGEKTAGGGVSSPRYTWQQGLRRLRLGRIMETEAPLEGAEGAFKGLLPYADLESGDLKLLERFCLAVESLHAHVVRLRRLMAVDPTWPDAFLDACTDLLDIGSASGGEADVQQALAAAFDALACFFPLSGSGAASPPMPVDILRAFVTNHLRGLSTSHGDYLTSGVTVAALQPMRPIPFEIIFILGMEEGGAFPGRADNSSLDLRLIQRRRGDVSTPER